MTLYTHRHYKPDQSIIKMFEDETNIKVKVVNASADELIQKMKMEGKQSPADVIITVDAGRLHRAKEQDLLQSIESDVLEKRQYLHTFKTRITNGLASLKEPENNRLCER